jgi:hypothetical protein
MYVWILSQNTGPSRAVWADPAKLTCPPVATANQSRMAAFSANSSHGSLPWPPEPRWPGASQNVPVTRADAAYVGRVLEEPQRAAVGPQAERAEVRHPGHPEGGEHGAAVLGEGPEGLGARCCAHRRGTVAACDSGGAAGVVDCRHPLLYGGHSAAGNALPRALPRDRGR